MDSLMSLQPLLYRSSAELLRDARVSKDDLASAGVARAVEATRRWSVSHDVKSFVGHCHTVARIVSESLKGLGLVAPILEGEIRIAANDYMEHRAVLLKRDRYWLFLDATSQQFDGFEGSDMGSVVSYQSSSSMLSALRELYSWC
jgi:hypothetical protein